jgi:N-acetylglutamate synthase-like GNAT family acetyltransferase
MKSIEIPMTSEEFEMREHPFGWKAEYWGGKAVFTPRYHIVTTKLDLTYRTINQRYPLLPVDIIFKEQMIEAFFESFQDSVEFCNWSLEEIQAEATRNINRYFLGKRGEPLSFSVIAVESETNHLIGLALFTKKYEQQTHLDLLLVKPSYQRKGVGKSMVSSAINQLCDQGMTELYSAYHICNQLSQQWHHAMGFKGIYDQYYIRLKYSWYRHEIWRHEQLMLNDKITSLIQQRDYWYNQLEDDWKF